MKAKSVIVNNVKTVIMIRSSFEFSMNIPFSNQTFVRTMMFAKSKTRRRERKRKKKKSFPLRRQVKLENLIPDGVPPRSRIPRKQLHPFVTGPGL